MIPSALLATAVFAAGGTVSTERPIGLGRAFAGGFPNGLSHASFDYGGVSRANTGAGDTLPEALQLEPDEEWTVAVWMRNLESPRSNVIACAFWGDAAISPQLGHIFSLFVYFDGGASDDHGNITAWVHGHPYRIGDSAHPLDDDEWHLVAIRNRNDNGTYRCALAYDGNSWTAEAPAPTVSLTDTTLPWSFNSMYHSGHAVPWIARRDCKLDELAVFDWALSDAEFVTLYNGGTPLGRWGASGLFQQLESTNKSITAHYMYGNDIPFIGSTTTTHKSSTNIFNSSLHFQVEGAGAGVIDTADYPGAP